MDARRLLTLFASRWWVIVVIAVASGAAGYLATDWQNSRIEEAYEAVAPVGVIQPVTEDSADYEDRLLAAEAKAAIALNPVISSDSRLSVRSAPDLKRLEFVAIAPTEADAISMALDLRAAYLEAEPTTGDVETLRGQQREIAVERELLIEKRDRLAAGAPLDPLIQAEIEFLEAALVAEQNRAIALRIAIRYPEYARTAETLDEEGNPLSEAELRVLFAETEERLKGFNEDLAALRASVLGASEPNPTLSLELLVLEEQIRELELAYLDLQLQIDELTRGVATPVGTSQVEFRSVTPVETSPSRNAALSALLGALAASVVIVVTDRIRRPILGIEHDLAVPMVATVDQSRLTANADRVWYQEAESA